VTDHPARLKNLRLLPKVRDSWSYLYVDRCRIDQLHYAIALHVERGVIPVPVASLNLLLLGPGTSITHAAIRTLADNGCLVGWVGEAGVRFYAAGLGETRSSCHLLHQASLWADPKARLETVVRMYRLRFDAGEIPAHYSLRQLRGREGLRVRAAYERASRETGVPWHGRNYDARTHRMGDPVNRALSTANACLYGICHAAIVAAGYSPAIGFIHTGNMLSFVFDIADLYKTDLSIPVAFRVVADGVDRIEERTRALCRDAFYRSRLLERIVEDLAILLDDSPQAANVLELVDAGFSPMWLWDPETEQVPAGVNYGDAEGQETGLGEASEFPD
jgi:CRISPR-associated protein Cas1